MQLILQFVIKINEFYHLLMINEFSVIIEFLHMLIISNY